MSDQRLAFRVQGNNKDFSLLSTVHCPLSTRILRGMTLVDVLVGTAVMLMVFLGIFGAFQLSIELVFNTKAKTGAVSLVTETLESIRSLPYDSVGTVGGIPAGTIPQVSQQTLNNITYTVRTVIQYVDAPEDGLDVLDENGITADYKVAKVEVLWTTRGLSRSTFALTRISPQGVENVEGGGTLRVNVFDSETNPVSGASVRIVNGTTNPAIDVTVASNISGSVTFPGAPEAAGYQITVSKTGFSSAQTYTATAENPNPNPGHVAVVEDQTTTISFAIDESASLSVNSFEPIGEGSFDDTFSDTSGLSSVSDTVVTNGGISLLDPGSGYALSGNAFSNPISPSYLAAWGEAAWNSTAPASTNFFVRVYAHDGVSYTLIPDVDLPNNSTGFASGPIDLSSLSVQTYPSLGLGAFFETTDASSTPSLADWEVSYFAGPTPLPNIDFTARGTKIIGITGVGQSIYKYNESTSTSASGVRLLAPLEWDAYTITLTEPGLDVVERCPFAVSVAPGAALTLSLILDTETTHSLLLHVTDGSVDIANASVTITGPTSRSGTTGSCGQAFFSGMNFGSHTVQVSAPGYQTYSEILTISGETQSSVTLLPN